MIINYGIKAALAGRILAGFLLAVWILVFTAPAGAKVYIDITSPGFKKLPLAVQPFIGGREISDVLKNDLAVTGLFDFIDEAAQIEKPDQPFYTPNWRGLGADMVIKGRVTPSPGNMMTVSVAAYDVTDGRELLRKDYAAATSLTRPIAHAIANDIYTILTGQPGVFKTKIVFVGDKGDEKELYEMDWDGHRLHGVGITGGILLSPRWSSDATKLVYSAERQRQWGIYLLNMNTMNERNIITLNGLNMAGNFLPGNREFLFSSSKDGNPDIYIAEISSMTGRKLISSPWIDVSPALSSDGSSLLFVSNRSGTPQIYMADKDGYNIRRLTFEGNYNTSPAWSQKGDKFAFVGRTGGGHHIFIMKPDGTGLTQLTTAGNNEDPTFSPDGRYIAFTSDRDGAKGIYLMRSNGEGQMRLTPKGFKAVSASWSPQ
jgi:TolB protein